MNWGKTIKQIVNRLKKKLVLRFRKVRRKWVNQTSVKHYIGPNNFRSPYV